MERDGDVGHLGKLALSSSSVLPPAKWDAG